MAIVVLCSQISKLICSAAGLDAPKYLLHKYQKDYLKAARYARASTAALPLPAAHTARPRSTPWRTGSPTATVGRTRPK